TLSKPLFRVFDTPLRNPFQASICVLHDFIVEGSISLLEMPISHLLELDLRRMRSRICIPGLRDASFTENVLGKMSSGIHEVLVARPLTIVIRHPNKILQHRHGRPHIEVLRHLLQSRKEIVNQHRNALRRVLCKFFEHKARVSVDESCLDDVEVLSLDCCLLSFFHRCESLRELLLPEEYIL